MAYISFRSSSRKAAIYEMLRGNGATAQEMAEYTGFTVDRVRVIIAEFRQVIDIETLRPKRNAGKFDVYDAPIYRAVTGVTISI
mgnify:CR=1 FL=1